MKILYAGSERSNAQAIATALRGLDQVVTVSWSSHLENASRWLDENRDLAAVVIETQVDDKTWPAVLAHVRNLPWHPAVVVIVPAEIDIPEPGPTVLYIRRNQSLLRDLPVVVTRAIERAARAALEQQLAVATSALQDAEQRHRAAVAATERQLAELQSQYEIGMARAEATWEMVDEQLRTAALEVERARQERAAAAADVDRLSRQLAEADAAVAAALARGEQERLAASDQLAEQQRSLQAEIAHEVDRRRGVEDLLEEAAGALDDAEKRHASEMRDATAQSRELEATLRQARQDLESTAAEVERLKKREEEINTNLAEMIGTRTDLERRLTATDAAFQEAVSRATRDRLEASRKAASREAELDGELQRERATRATIEQAVTEQQARFDRELTQAAADCDRLAHQLTETDAALEQARRDHRAAAADVERLREREAELTSQCATVQAAVDALEQAVATGETALRAAQERHDAALAAAANELAERQAHFDRELTQTSADRDRLARQLTETDAALEQSRHERQAAAADVDRLTAREADLTSRLTEVRAARKTLERQLAKATKSIREGAAREAELDQQIQRELGIREALEQAIEDAEASLRETRQQHEAALAAAAADLALREAGFDHLLSERTADRDRLIQRLDDVRGNLDDVCLAYEYANTDVERLTRREAELATQLTEAEAALVDAQQRHDAALAAAANHFAEYQARLDRELLAATDECDRLSEQLSDAGVSLEQARQDHQAAVADVEHALRHNAELRSELAVVQTERNTLGQSLADTRARALEHEQQFKARLEQDRLEYERRMADAQTRTQELQAALTASTEGLEASRADNHRLFEQSELAMFRCTPDGTLIDANRACTTLVGRRTTDELREARFPAAAFDAPNALFWVIERCLSTRIKETVEATWRRHDQSRLFVRLSARSAGSDVIEFIAEDLTRVRILEERLSQAHRMEAVGRLAAEISVTCGNLLTDIHHSGREWLGTIGGVDSRQRGERLLDDIKRAASLMQELAACGDEQQARTPMLVDLHTLIRDLEPVLKRVAGGDVDVQLQDNASPLNVDVGTERIERLLVNLASYGRERMPFGGRLRIELGKSVVDRRFAAKHPNVRLGLHALITVTEIRRPAQTDEPSQPRARKPGVDFGTLQGLVSECGGHLWMKIQPPGEMVAKIRLPLSVPREQTPPRPRMARVGRERLPARWFQS
jgi:predicted  nucleic acid-binding Zn-ribbon protein